MDRSRFGRALAILAVAALAVAVVSPAFSVVTLTKAKVKKIATKVAKKQVKNLGGQLFVSREDLFPVGPIHMNAGDAEHTIGTFGPFTLTTRCLLVTGNVEATVLIRTSEADSTLQSYDWFRDFQPADGAINFSEEVEGNPPGGTIYGRSAPLYYHGGHAIAPSGTSILGMIDPITNFDGSHCYFDGFLMDLSA
jgi:hypothetical protein